MKKLVVVIAVTLILSGCSLKLPKTDEIAPADDETKTTQVAFLGFAQELGNEAVEYFLGREYNTAYRDLFAGLGSIIEDEKPIYIHEDASTALRHKLSEAIIISMTLPGSPDYIPPEIDRGMEASGADQHEADPGVMDEISEFQRQMFPDGTAPNTPALDSTGRVTDSFKSWFMSRAVELGWVDSHLKLDDSNQLYVLSGDYVEGSTYKVLGSSYEPSLVSPVITSKEVNTSKTYKLVRSSYISFDNGTYQAIYTTDPTIGAPNTVSIEVTFVCTGVTSDTIEGYINSIDNVRVRLL